jgi:CRISPR-associated protein Csm1
MTSPQRVSPAQLAALGGLLHDIGKFRQRAFWSERRSHEDHGRRWTEQKVLPRLRFLTDQEKSQLAEAVEKHHESGAYARDVRVVRLADRLASGERVPRDREEGTGDPATELLLPVFTALRLDSQGLDDTARRSYAYPTAPLSLDASIFPAPRETLRADYPALWQHFEKAWESFPDASPAFHDPDAFALAWLSLLRAYAWCVPAAAYVDEPDVSLADHLQVTGALAACLWDLPEEALAGLEADSSRDEPVALLTGGDVSGIQRFLYTVSSSGAAKSLRGRSAYLSLLCDAVAEYVRRGLEVPPCNVLYSSGGHFYLLAPLRAEGELPRVREEVLRVLLDFFGGDVAVVLEAVELLASDLKVDPHRPRSPLGDRWRELSGKLRAAKQTLLREAARTDPGKVFGPFGVGGPEVFCVVCHSEPDQPAGLKARGLSRPVAVTAAEEADRKCSLCESFEELSSRIARAEYLVLRSIPPRAEGELKWHSVLTALGLELWLDRGDELLEHHRDGDWVLRLNDASLAAVKGPSATVPVLGFRFLPNFTPFQDDGAIREMADLAQASDGAPYFGALRMDVDNLGRLFSEGLGGRLSISRLATFSRALSIFFEGYLNRICEQLDPHRAHLYLLYSGGDDLLAVGSWDKVVSLADRVRQEFRRYTCQNPALTLSGGTSLHHEKFPLYQAAEAAGDLLETAKAWKRDGKTKDAFDLWGQPLEWEEVAWARGWHGRITGWLDRDGIRRAFVFKLARIASMHDEVKPRLSHLTRIRRRVRHERWLWTLVYYLAKESEELEPELRRLRDELVNQDRIRCLATLARWVELSTRHEDTNGR